MAQSEPDDSTLDLPAIEADLRERLADLEGREEELKRPPEEGADIGFGKRIGDGTNQAIGRITDVGVADSLDHIEARIIRALEKLDEGTYGVCDGCGERIPAGRLHAAPESALCVNCAASSHR
ncbi:MAG: TraR/DksA C4-type zinc finger protein [Solirubrobacterales bacterium]|nr:TraR/DksA C4-type zinc finger protein [Solirubrobacterales bacterium]MCB8971107.1 TraR/DksA C4-type zinc finger protein [Thermoleophilales bacterium]MCO5327894.1 TraR/DksA C4-type zinc finger protein [Solirubrobacterales bacterium]